MKFKAVFVVLALLGLVGCKPTDEDVANSAKEQINRYLKDPTSSLFRDVVVYRDGDDTAYVCGDVNAKNEYGAYTGFESFMGKVYINDGKFVPLVSYEKNYNLDELTPTVCQLKSVEQAKNKVAELELELKKQKLLEEKNDLDRIEANRKKMEERVSKERLNEVLRLHEKTLSKMADNTLKLNESENDNISVVTYSALKDDNLLIVSTLKLDSVNNEITPVQVSVITNGKDIEHFGLYIHGYDEMSDDAIKNMLIQLGETAINGNFIIHKQMIKD
ncbi:hypothetical protein ON011_003261 [Providencia rettgeri]|nr:hypothetical protein [Providencia rettgeri]